MWETLSYAVVVNLRSLELSLLLITFQVVSLSPVFPKRILHCLPAMLTFLPPFHAHFITTTRHYHVLFLHLRLIQPLLLLFYLHLLMPLFFILSKLVLEVPQAVLKRFLFFLTQFLLGNIFTFKLTLVSFSIVSDLSSLSRRSHTSTLSVHFFLIIGRCDPINVKELSSCMNVLWDSAIFQVAGVVVC